MHSCVSLGYCIPALLAFVVLYIVLNYEAKRSAGKNVSEMTPYVSSETRSNMGYFCQQRHRYVCSVTSSRFGCFLKSYTVNFVCKFIQGHH